MAANILSHAAGRFVSVVAVWVMLAAAPGAATAGELAPTGILRATFIDTNPVQARIDAATGEARGPAADLARALAAKLGVALALKPARGVAGVIESVKAGAADIGFVAFDATRAEQVDFSQAYLLAHNSYVVRADATARSVGDLDRAGVRIGVGAGDAGDLFLTRTLKSAELRRMPGTEFQSGIRMVLAGELDAYAANRTRLIEVATRETGLRLMPDNFFSVEQSIALAKGNAAGLAAINAFLTEARSSGLIAAAIERVGLKGVDVAPANTR